MLSTRLKPFGTSIFTEMTKAAVEHGAINLGQGFPDFEGPPEIREFAAQAMADGHNQYARSMGHPILVQALARAYERNYGLALDPMTEICVTSGATEAIASTLLGLLEPGDEVVCFEPFYDSYPAVIAMAGGHMRSVPLLFPDFALDLDALEARIGPKTRVLLLNTPHNPTGKVFTRDELTQIAELCARHDLIAVTDEVYEHLWFDDHRHVPLATLDGMRERTLTISSMGKTFSYTGWKIGWCAGRQTLLAATAGAHQFVTFATATPLQVAMGRALEHFGDAFLDQFRREYGERRELLCGMLEAAGFRIARPDGTYFAIADISGVTDEDDRTYAHRLIKETGVATCPTSTFYKEAPEEGRRLIRFAFCKELETLELARERLASLRS